MKFPYLHHWEEEVLNADRWFWHRNQKLWRGSLQTKQQLWRVFISLRPQELSSAENQSKPCRNNWQQGEEEGSQGWGGWEEPNTTLTLKMMLAFKIFPSICLRSPHLSQLTYSATWTFCLTIDCVFWVVSSLLQRNREEQLLQAGCAVLNFLRFRSDSGEQTSWKKYLLCLKD